MSMTLPESISAAPLPAWRSLLASADGRVGFGLTFGMLAFIALGPWLAPYSPTTINLAPANAGPSWTFLLGTDHLGRDVLSRVLWGGRSIIGIPLVSVSLAYLTVGLLSVVAAYRGGVLDLVVSRLSELLMSLPSLLKTLILVAAFGPSPAILILAIMVSNMPGASRVVRGAVLSQSGLDYVMAAQARGETTMAIVIREIIPNILSPVVADFTLRITWAVIALSTLSFLGLGVQPPNADWGLMIQEARSSLQQAPLVAIVPALAIALLSVGLNFSADAMIRHMTGRKPGGA